MPPDPTKADCGCSEHEPAGQIQVDWYPARCGDVGAFVSPYFRGKPHTYWWGYHWAYASKHKAASQQNDAKLVEKKPPELYEKVDQKTDSTARKTNGDDKSNAQKRNEKDKWKQTADEERKPKAKDGPVKKKVVVKCGSSGAPPKDIPCANKSLTISCGHKERDYEQQSPTGMAILSGRMFDVLGGETDIIQAKTKITAGPCGTHNLRVWNVSPDWVQPKSNDSYSFEAHAIDVDLTDLWPSDPNVRNYYLHAYTCQNTSETATIRVVPDIGWSVKLRMTGFSSSTETKGGVKTSTQKEEGIELTVTRTHNGNTMELSGQFLTYKEKLKRALNILERVVKGVGKVSEQLAVKIDVKVGFLDVKGEWKWRECSKSWRCEYHVQIEFGCHPLFSIQCKVDILGALLRLIGPFGRFIDEIRKKAETSKTVKLKIHIFLIIGGKVDGAVRTEMAKYLGDGRYRTLKQEGQIKISIPFGIEGEVEGGLDLGYFVIAAGVRVGLETGLSGTISVGADGIGPYVDFQMKLEAGEFYWATYVGENSQVELKDPTEIWGEQELGGGITHFAN